MTQHRDKKRKRELLKQLNENPVDTVVNAINKELGQIKERINKRRKEEYEETKRRKFKDTECPCGNIFLRKNLSGNAAVYCPECRAALNKKNVPYAKRKNHLIKCACGEEFKNINGVRHEGKMICGKCWDRITEEQDTNPDTCVSLENWVSSHSQMGNGIDQAQVYSAYSYMEAQNRNLTRRHVKK